MVQLLLTVVVAGMILYAVAAAAFDPDGTRLASFGF